MERQHRRDHDEIDFMLAEAEGEDARFQRMTLGLGAG